ncbi:hypothetical protein L903_01610 [Agrobacterium sp. JL28]|nr:hypothetical protein L902_34255 [Agrobacterium radiobacter DSM 30147]KVK52060.1 hypothetical protein L903_01610 [Agrobacterium sp. JL28]
MSRRWMRRASREKNVVMARIRTWEISVMER